jgi:Arc/MetJ-type ribon-helix-helix transcriptional regulator
MPTVKIEITEAAKSFVDQEVASGRFKNGGALIEMLLARAMWLRERGRNVGFTPEDRQRIDVMLQEAMSSFARGEYAAVAPGEFEALARRLVEQHPQKQAS